MNSLAFQARWSPALLLLATLLLTLTACAGRVSAEPSPPTIHYGEDVCEFCGMIITEERYAAGYLTKDGADHIFDDIGNMFRAHVQNQAEVTAFFVHDYEEQTWIRAETAYYVLSRELPTPMASGLVAFRSEARNPQELGLIQSLTGPKVGGTLNLARLIANPTGFGTAVLGIPHLRFGMTLLASCGYLSSYDYYYEERVN
jgi:copper chaperone NosL